MRPASARERVILALDQPTLAAAEGLLDELSGKLAWTKVGKQLFTREGPAALRAVQQRGSKVFLDLKYHDIPNTVASAVASACELGAGMLTLHASGGPRMLQAAAEAKLRAKSDCILLAVTVLTSFDSSQLARIGIEHSVSEQVSLLAALAADSGADGLVCSPHEAARLRSELGPKMLLVTPGVRPAGSDKGDQSRVATPRSAVEAGADFLVIGRPIHAAETPLAALQSIVAELEA